LAEEQGGFILKEAGKENYEFVPVKNKITGTTQAVGLYVADDDEFNNNVFLRTIDDGWSIFASYHTHPLGMRAMPSSIDVNMLFTSFPINFIYAPSKELNRFDYNPNHVKEDNHSKWLYSSVLKFHGFAPDQGRTYMSSAWIESENL
jgi:proteasome lid subunit RPN8/RPN11